MMQWVTLLALKSPDKIFGLLNQPKYKVEDSFKHLHSTDHEYKEQDDIEYDHFLSPLAIYTTSYS